MARAADHDYSNPPVYEALIGVEFAPTTLNIVELGESRPLWRAEYPQVQVLPALPPTVITGQTALPGFAITFGAQPPPSGRIWYLTADDEYVLQLQNDRLLLNWRKASDAATYPRYSALKQRFDAHWRDLTDFFAKSGSSNAAITAVEFSYFNRLPDLTDMTEAFSVLSAYPNDLPGEAGSTSFQIVRDLPRGDYPARGQVTIEGTPVADAGGGVQLTISVRYFPVPQEDGAQMTDLIDSAHDTARATFSSITSKSMQASWGRHDSR